MTDGIPDDETKSREDTQRPVEQLVIRLRGAANNKSLDIGTAWNLLDEAADVIETLNNERLRSRVGNTP